MEVRILRYKSAEPGAGGRREFARVLRPGGALVVARPGPLHLQGVKALIYRDVAPQVTRAGVCARDAPTAATPTASATRASCRMQASATNAWFVSSGVSMNAKKSLFDLGTFKPIECSTPRLAASLIKNRPPRYTFSIFGVTKSVPEYPIATHAGPASASHESNLCVRVRAALDRGWCPAQLGS